MRNTLLFLLLGTQLAWSTAADARSKIYDPPKHYYFNYEYQNNRVIDQSVCNQYSGMEWKECRRYAQYVFRKRCSDYGLELRHKKGKVRREIQEKRERYCDAKRRITPLGSR